MSEENLFESTSSSDPTFVRLRDDPELAGQRAFINRLFNDYRFERYADKDFRSKFPLECAARFWELYLGCALLESGFRLVPRKDRQEASPDFCIKQDGSHIWIEAVAPTIGSGADSLPLKAEGPDDRFQIVPEDTMILRYCSAIRDKHCRHLRHLSDALVPASDPFIIAINGAGLPIQFRDTGIELPSAIRAVLPYGRPTITIGERTEPDVKEGYEYRTFIVKLSGSQVPTTSFLDCTFSLISGLLFTNADPFFCNNIGMRSFSFLHNYSALHEIPEGFFEGVEWHLKTEGNNLVLEARWVAT